MSYAFQFRDVWRNFDLLVEGALLTLQFAAVTMAIGLAIGIVGAACRTGTFRLAWWVATVYVEVIRNTPLLVQLLIIFLGLPALGLTMSANQAAMVGLSINVGAYLTEIVRAGIEAVPRSQIEAGYSLGLSRLQVFRYVILFPALKTIYPSLTSQFILLLIATSVVSQISATELFHMGGYIESRTFRSFEVYLVVTLMYLVIALGFRALFSAVHWMFFERR